MSRDNKALTTTIGGDPADIRLCIIDHAKRIDIILEFLLTQITRPIYGDSDNGRST